MVRGKFCIIGFLICVVLLLMQTFCMANTYYVAENGSDGNPGTSGSPWATIDHGDKAGLLAPGDTVIVKTGEYDVSKSNSLYAADGPTIGNKSGTAGNPITYQAESDVIINRGADDGWALWVSGGQYIIIDGFHFKGGDFTFKLQGSSYCEVRNCTFTDKGNDNSGITLDGSYSYGNNLIHHNIVSPNRINAYGIWVTGAGDKVYNNTVYGTTSTYYYGLIAVNGSEGIEFKNNIVYNSWGGLSLYNTTGITHSHNIFYGIGVYFYNGTTQDVGEMAGTDPMLTNPANGDFSLQAGSPAIDSGALVGFAFNGTWPDIGAVESDGTPDSGAFATVSGKVTDSVSGAPIPKAVVQVGANDNAVATTDANGDYTIVLPVGSHSIKTTHPIHYDKTETYMANAGSDTHNIQLDPKPLHTYYISPNGSDNGAGTESSPWASIDKPDHDGILNPGDTVIVMTGEYDVSKTNANYQDGGPTIINCSGTDGYPIIYKAQSGAVVDRGADAGWALWVENNKYIVVDGFHFKGGDFMFKLVGSSYCEVKNCLITDKGNDNSGIALDATYSSGNNLIHNNIVSPNGINVYGIWIMGAGDKVYNNTVYGTTSTYRYGIIGAYGAAGMEFRNNIVSDSFGGIDLYDTTGVIQSNNIYYNIGCFFSPHSDLGPGEMAGTDPMLTDPANGDFSLQAGSPAIDAGYFVGLPFNGSWPDIGAIESAGTPNNGVLGIVTGKVTDAVTTASLSGATVTCGPNSNAIATTNSTGDYTLQLPLGLQSMKARMAGYTPKTKTADIAAGSQTVDFQLSGPVDVTELGDLRNMEDETLVRITDPKVVTASPTSFYDGGFYAEETEKYAGIRLVFASEAFSAEIGDKITFDGELITDSDTGERAVSISAITNRITGGTEPLPIGMNNKSISGFGASVQGLLVTTWGKVTYKADDSSFMYINDGSNCVDGNPYGLVGTLVLLGTSQDSNLPLAANVGDGIVITGLVGAYKSGNMVLPAIKPRFYFDITPYTYYW